MAAQFWAMEVARREAALPESPRAGQARDNNLIYRRVGARRREPLLAGISESCHLKKFFCHLCLKPFESQHLGAGRVRDRAELKDAAGEVASLCEAGPGA